MIHFRQLSDQIMRQVVDKFIDELRRQLAPKKIAIELAPEALAWLAERGFDRRYGARPLGRLIQTEIKDALSEEMLFGRLQKGGTVMIRLDGDRLSFGFPDGKSE